MELTSNTSAAFSSRDHGSKRHELSAIKRLTEMVVRFAPTRIGEDRTGTESTRTAFHTPTVDRADLPASEPLRGCLDRIVRTPSDPGSRRKNRARPLGRDRYAQSRACFEQKTGMYPPTWLARSILAQVSTSGVDFLREGRGAGTKRPDLPAGALLHGSSWVAGRSPGRCPPESDLGNPI
jgi:hypothetical protein